MARILVVEDEPRQREDLEWAASGAGQVVSVPSGQDAIQTIAKESFDVVVTDLEMETKEAGLEVLRAAKQKDIYTQVIMVTAYGAPRVSVEAMRMGAFDYIERNAPGTDVLAMIKSKIALALEFRIAMLKVSEAR